MVTYTRGQRGFLVNQDILLICGALVLPSYVAMYLIGGALRPGYNHISDSVSELLTPGAPNKPLLVVIQLAYATLHILFGLGVLGFVQAADGTQTLGAIGAWMIVLLGVVTVGTAIFPQDPEDAPPTTPGRVHVVLVFGGLVPLSLLSTLLLGIWSAGAGLPGWFDVYSYVTVVAIVVMGGLGGAAMKTEYGGLVERVAAIVTQQWLFVLALTLLQL
jgi:hypothetical protein